MSTRKDRDAAHLVSRRALIKYATFLGASLGVPRWKVFEVLEKTGGEALAAQAAGAATNRSVHLVAGNGGLAWFTQLFPFPEIALSNNANFSYYAMGQATMVAGTDRPYASGPATPWKSLAPAQQVTAILHGQNQTHTGNPTSTLQTGTTSVLAAIAALQATSPTLVPAIVVGAQTPFGAAAGAPAATRVNQPSDMVGLFNSAASQANGVAAADPDKAVVKTAVSTALALNRLAGLPTTRESIGATQTAANLLTRNLANALTPSAADLTRYGITGASPARLTSIATTLITTAKAFALDLTSSVTLSAMNDDPHGAFGDLATLQTTALTLATMLDAFYADLAVPDPRGAGAQISDNTVLSIHGDTFKDPRQRGGWPDGTTGNSNITYIRSAGNLRSGLFGNISAAGQFTGWDPATGANANATSASLGMAGQAALLGAVAKRDRNLIGRFFTGSVEGIVRPKDL
jgi:hypothetical protein